MSSPEDLNALLRQGIELARSGHKDRARAIFEQVLQADEYNEVAWMWMASVAVNNAQRREALEIALEINPHNERARHALERLGGSRASRLAQESAWLAGRIGGEAVDEAALQVVAERPPKPAPEPEPAPDPAAAEAARLRRLLEAARREEEAAQEAAARDLAPAPSPPPPAKPEVEYYDFAADRRRRVFRTVLGALPTVLLVLVGAALVTVVGLGLLQIAPRLAQIGQPPPPTPTPTEGLETALARLATPTPTTNPYVVIVPRPPATEEGTLPPSWTPSITPSATATPRPTATPIPASAYRLIFSSRRGQAETGSLYVIRGDGAEERRLTGDGFDARHPAVRPDREQVAYVGRTALFAYLLNAPPPPPTATPPLTEADEAEAGATPAGDETATPPGDPATRFIFDLGGGRTRSPSWSPDGTRVVFSADADGDEEIYVVSADGTSLAQLTNNVGIADRDPAWSPDGQTILFASDRDGPGQMEIYAMRPNGTEVRRLTDSAGSSYQPAWSGDGQAIVFVSDRDRDADLYLMDADGANERLLTRDDGDAEDRDPAWSPDNRWIVFSSNRESANFQLYLIDPSGATLLRVTANDGDDEEAVWLDAPVF